MKKPQIRFRSFYAKLVIMFLFMGLIPFLLMGMLIYNVYSNTMYENILGNFSMFLIMIIFMSCLKIRECLKQGGMQ